MPDGSLAPPQLTRATDPVAPEVPAAAPALDTPWCAWTWLLGGFALVVRVVVVLFTHVTLQADSADYQRLGLSLAGGHGFGASHFTPAGGPTALRPPLYPLALGAFYKVMGNHITGARLAGAVGGALTVVFLVALTWYLWGRRVALVAGVLASCFPALILASTSIMSESVALPLETAGLLLVVLFRRSGRWFWAAGAGAALACMALTRPSMEVLVVPMAVLLYRRWPSWRQLSSLGIFVLSGLIVIAPWMVRDYQRFHTWVPLTTQSGYVLAGTYNTTSADDTQQPAAWRPANFDPQMERIIVSNRHDDEVQLGAKLQSAALHYLRDHPTYLFTVVYQNSVRLFDFAPLSFTRQATAEAYGVAPAWGDAEAVTGIAMLVLALGGVALRRGRRVPLWYLLAPVLLWLGTVVFQAIPRFRAVIDPFMVQFAAVALVTAAERFLPALRRRGAR